jgi:hypothetical protein
MKAASLTTIVASLFAGVALGNNTIKENVYIN